MIFTKIRPDLRGCFVLTLAFLSAALSSCNALTLDFPQAYVPFTSIYYVTQPDSNGYSLVVGKAVTLAANEQLFDYLSSLPSLSGNQLYATEPIELAPGLFFNNVLVPTSAEREGNFEDFGGPLMDPLSSVPFAGNIIPVSRLFDPFAFRIGPQADAITAAPEPGGVLPSVLAMLCVVSVWAVAFRREGLRKAAARCGMPFSRSVI